MQEFAARENERAELCVWRQNGISISLINGGHIMGYPMALATIQGYGAPRLAPEIRSRPPVAKSVRSCSTGWRRTDGWGKEICALHEPKESGEFNCSTLNTDKRVINQNSLLPLWLSLSFCQSSDTTLDACNPSIHLSVSRYSLAKSKSKLGLVSLIRRLTGRWCLLERRDWPALDLSFGLREHHRRLQAAIYITN